MVGVETSVWNAEEIEAFQQAMMKYDKDFFLVSKQVNVCTCLVFTVRCAVKNHK